MKDKIENVETNNIQDWQSIIPKNYTLSMRTKTITCDVDLHDADVGGVIGHFRDVEYTFDKLGYNPDKK